MKLQDRLGAFQRQKYKTISFNGHDLEVYVPTRNEMKELSAKFRKPADEMVEAEYQALLQSLWEFATPADEGIEVKDADVMVQGQSMKTTARYKAIQKMREIAMISLVGFKEGEDLFALSYEDISETLSEVDIKNLVDMVQKTVDPSYEETKKN